LQDWLHREVTNGLCAQEKEGIGGIDEAPVKMAIRNKQGFASAFARKPLILDGARSRNRTGTPLRAGDFKSIIFFI